MATNRLARNSSLAAVALVFVGGFEGLRTYAYPDVIGVWTACYGETKGIKKGMTFTKAECDQMFARRLIEFDEGMRKCLVNPDAIPPKPYIAFLDLSYNIGTGGFCKSSVAAAANTGNYKVACQRLARFTKAGGRVIKGLVLRRQSEIKYCLSGL